MNTTDESAATSIIRGGEKKLNKARGGPLNETGHNYADLAGGQFVEKTREVPRDDRLRLAEGLSGKQTLVSINVGESVLILEDREGGKDRSCGGTSSH